MPITKFDVRAVKAIIKPDEKSGLDLIEIYKNKSKLIRNLFSYLSNTNKRRLIYSENEVQSYECNVSKDKSCIECNIYLVRQLHRRFPSEFKVDNLCINVEKMDKLTKKALSSASPSDSYRTNHNTHITEENKWSNSVEIEIENNMSALQENNQEKVCKKIKINSEGKHVEVPTKPILTKHKDSSSLNDSSMNNSSFDTSLSTRNTRGNKHPNSAEIKDNMNISSKNIYKKETINSNGRHKMTTIINISDDSPFFDDTLTNNLRSEVTDKSWMNDIVMNDFLKTLKPPSNVDICSTYSAVFLSKLGEKENIKLEAKKYLKKETAEWIIIPVNIPNYHWNLLIYNKRKVRFYFMDSLNKNPISDYKFNYTVLCKNICFSVGTEKTSDLIPIKVPKQRNDNDCGFLVVAMIEKVLQGEKFSLSDLFDTVSTLDWSQWFDPDKVGIDIRNRCKEQQAQLQPKTMIKSNKNQEQGQTQTQETEKQDRRDLVIIEDVASNYPRQNLTDFPRSGLII